MERETAPGHGAERKFLPPDLRRRYDERGMRKTIELLTVSHGGMKKGKTRRNGL